MLVNNIQFYYFVIIIQDILLSSTVILIYQTMFNKKLNIYLIIELYLVNNNNCDFVIYLILI